MPDPIRFRHLFPEVEAPETWVILPTIQLQRELARLCLESGRSFVGLHLLTPDLALGRMLADRGMVPRKLLGQGCREALLRRIIETFPGDRGEDLAYLWDFPSTIPGLLRVLDDLRSWGLTGREEVGDLPTGLGALCWEILRELDRHLEARGCLDPASLTDLAIRAFEERSPGDPERVLVFAPGPRVSGNLVRLCRALEGRAELRWLTQAPPGEEEGIPARSKLLFEPGEEAPEPLPEDRFRIFAAQGEEAELREAVQRARRLVAEQGCRPDRIALVCTQAEAYEPFLAPLSRTEGLPLDTWIGSSLLSEPPVSLALSLVELASGRASRSGLLSCLAHPALDLEGLLPGRGVLLTPGNLGLLDRWTLEAGCLEGDREVLEALKARESMKGRKAEARDLRALLEPLFELLEGVGRSIVEASSPAGQARALADFLDRALLRRDARDEHIVTSLLAQCRSLGELALVGHPPLEPEALLARIRSLWEEETARHESFQKEGVRFLPLARFPGLEVDHVFLLGFGRDRFPPKTHPDAWFGAGDRRRLRSFLREKWGPLPKGLLPPPPLAEEAEEVHGSLLRALLAGTRESLTLSFLRADSLGKEKAPSLWLRHLTRALLGTEQVEEVLCPESPWFAQVPSSPPERLRYRLEEGRPLSENEALDLAALEGGPGALLALAQRMGSAKLATLERGCLLILHRNRFHARKRADHAFDALDLEIPPPSSLTVSAFETLGRCPLRFFFEEILGLRPLPEPAAPDSLRARDLGIALHALLGRIFQTLMDEGRFEPEADLQAARRRAGELLDSKLASLELLPPLGRELPFLRQALQETWGEGLRRLLRLDFREMEDSGFRPRAVEHPVEGELRLGGGAAEEGSLRLEGRLDRLDEDGEGRKRILDYKSGGSFPSPPILGDCFKGTRLQLPLYVLLLGPGHAGAELRGVSLAHLRSAGDAPPGRPLSPKLWEQEEGFRESLGVLRELLLAGCFPFSKGDHCGYCEFRAACPRHHPPSQERMRAHPLLGRFFLLQKKSSKLPTLASIPEEEG